ncbi:MAG: NYN domain-containing protein [Pseudomarimonas sp.]
MRTIAFVDGYNLFFGCLKNTPYKWLDLVALIKLILHVQDPKSDLVQVRYFTAPIKARLASHGNAAANAQDRYHRAIQQRGRVEIYNGWYSLEGAWAPRKVVPPNKQDRVEIWRLEEKESDVHLALQLYRDAIRGECEQAVLVTSDSDLVPALKLLCVDAPEVRRGLILPRREQLSGEERRPANASLSQFADWTRQEIKNAELAACQLPARVPTAKKPIDKPDYW